LPHQIDGVVIAHLIGIILHGRAKTLCPSQYSLAALRNAAEFSCHDMLSGTAATRYESDVS